jgi:hypothetical protein
VITYVAEYVIDLAKINAFERFAQAWTELTGRRGDSS